MSIPTDIKHIVRDDDVLGGKPHIEGHRIAVHHIAWWYAQGKIAEAIIRARRGIGIKKAAGMRIENCGG